MKQAKAMVIKEQALDFLKALDFNEDKFEPIIVQFRNNGKENRQNYLYCTELNTVEVGDYVVVPVYSDDSFTVAEVVQTISDFKEDFHHIIESSVDKTLEYNKNIVRPIVTNLGNYCQGELRDYYQNLRNEKRKKEVKKLIKEQAEDAVMMASYQTLANFDPKLKKLLEEYNSL